MFSNMRNKYLEMLASIEVTDVATNPNMVMMTKLYKALQEGGFTDQQAAIIVGNMKIEINEDFVEDEELVQTTLTRYVSELVKVKKYVDSINPLIFLEYIRSQGFSLTYKST